MQVYRYSGRCVFNKSKRSCTNFCGCTNCENANPSVALGKVQDGDDECDL